MMMTTKQQQGGIVSLPGSSVVPAYHSGNGFAQQSQALSSLTNSIVPPSQQPGTQQQPLPTFTASDMLTDSLADQAECKVESSRKLQSKQQNTSNNNEEEDMIPETPFEDPSNGIQELSNGRENENSTTKIQDTLRTCTKKSSCNGV